MELTELKSFKNAGGSVYSSIGSSDSSKTVGYKLINNLPKFADGIITLNSTPGLQNSFLAPVIERTVSPNNINMSDSSNLSAIQKANIRAGGTGEYNNYTKSVIGLNTGSLTNSSGGAGKTVGPTSTGGKGFNWSGVGNVVTSGVLFAGDAINSFLVNETGEDILQKYGTSQLNVGGIGYESQNMIDLNKEMDRVKSENTGNTLKTVGSGAALGAAAGSIIPGLGTIAGGLIGAGVGLITGIFGGEARKREYRRLLAKQNSKINALQDSARFSAQTKAIQLQNAREYGNSESQYLYGAKEGKLPEVDPKTMLSKDKLLSITPNGYTVDNADSMVEPGETLFNTETGSMMQVPRLASGKLHPGDIQPAKIGNAAVFTDRHKDPITGKSFALAAIDGDDDPYNLLYRQKVLVNDKKNNKGLMKAKNGRLPKFDNGWVGNAITSGIGALGGLSLWLEAKNSTPKKTNSYRANPYEGVSLDILSRLGISPFPTMQNIRNAEARANRAIDMSGGLTTGQRTLTRLASLNNTQRAVADALLNIQMQNNNYFADYAKTALAAGAANAQRAMLANMYDEEMYAKAHAARQLGMLMGMRNMIDLLNNFYANEFKRRQFNEAMGLYKQDQKLRANEVLAIINNLNSNKNSNYSNYSHVNSIAPTYMGDYGLKKDWSIAGNSKLKNPKLFWGKDYSLTAPILPTSYTTYKYIKPYDNIRLR